MAGWMYWLTKYTSSECTVTFHNIATFYTTIPTYIEVRSDTLVDKMFHFHYNLCRDGCVECNNNINVHSLFVYFVSRYTQPAFVYVKGAWTYCIINEWDQPAAKECNRKLYNRQKLEKNYFVNFLLIFENFLLIGPSTLKAL